jgi:DNA-binding response OmpR family regulator
MVFNTGGYQMRRKILVVDDEHAILSVLDKFLTKEGFDVRIMSDGAQALEFIKSGGDVDLAILDLRMPGMTGLEIARSIRNFKKNFPIIVISGGNIEKEEPELLELDCGPILAKPIDLRKFIAVIEDKLSFYRDEERRK